MVLRNTEAKSLDRRATLIHKELAEMNITWVNSQKKLQLKEIKDKMVKKQKNVDYILKLMAMLFS